MALIQLFCSSDWELLFSEPDADACKFRKKKMKSIYLHSKLLYYRHLIQNEELILTRKGTLISTVEYKWKGPTTWVISFYRKLSSQYRYDKWGGLNHAHCRNQICEINDIFISSQKRKQNKRQRCEYFGAEPREESSEVHMTSTPTQTDGILSYTG